MTGKMKKIVIPIDTKKLIWNVMANAKQEMEDIVNQ